MPRRDINPASRDSSDDEPFFHYVIEIAGKELLVSIMANGTGHWDDHSNRRALRHPRDRDLELRAFDGDRQALNKLQNEISEFTLAVAMPEKVLRLAGKMGHEQSKQKVASAKAHAVSFRVAQDMVQMDQLLTDFFWQEVNPFLSLPLQRPNHNH